MIARFRRALIHYYGIKIGVLLNNLSHKISVKTLPSFSNSPKNLLIEFPRRINNPNRITIGDDVSLGPGSFLSAISQYPAKWMKSQSDNRAPQIFESRIVIGNRVTATADLQVTAAKEIVIEDDVMFASNVHINDSSHGYKNANIPYKYQPLTKIASIRIKRGCWIGQNAFISSGVTIGELTIIGANTVVKRDIPDRCIAVGSPARIIKKWCDNKQLWVDVAGPNK